ncbi:hypothetical protein, partial [Ferruginibacter sp.]
MPLPPCASAGNVRWSNVDGFVRLLEQGFGVRAEQRGGIIVLHSHRRAVDVAKRRCEWGLPRLARLVDVAARVSRAGNSKGYLML